jgi:uncharacterized protein (TIGR02391 family)
MAVPSLEAGAVEGVARAIGEAFSGTEIDRLLTASSIEIPDVSTKWRRIDAALMAEQARSGSGTSAVVLVQQAMQPVRWASNRARFDTLRDELNVVLAYAGLAVGKDGQVFRRKAATTHDEAAATSRRLRDEMSRRSGHAQVFKYCSAELVAQDCFNAVFEATKGLAERIREMTGLDLDGHRLVAAAFESDTPRVALNSLRTDTERNEQRGLANIMKGVFSAFRNPSAHEPKLAWHVAEADALDLLCTLSLVHRRLDQAVVLRRDG